MNRYELALQVLARLEPELADRYPELYPEIIEGEFREQNYLPPPPTSLRSLINETGPFPASSVILGLCDDGLPFMLDLLDPGSGSLLIAGDRGVGKTNLLKTILASAAYINNPGEVRFGIISSRAQELLPLGSQPHCISISDSQERSAFELIMTLAELTEQRRSGRNRGPAIVLAIDNFEFLATAHLDYSLFVHLRWLIQNGPKSQVWPIVTVTADRILDVDQRLIKGFKTKLLGSMHSGSMRKKLTGRISPTYPNSNGTPLFEAHLGRQSTPFYLPAP